MSDDYRSSVSVSDEESNAASSPVSFSDRDVPRRRARGSSVHTAAALDVVDERRQSLQTPATRSVRYSEVVNTMPSPDARVYPTPPPHSSRRTSARPATAASATALAGLVPTGGDRLKHLQVHMEQLQQLYAQEIHKEELAQREAFVQSMCTSSITLWRYVCSKPRFFTAVKALVTQYLPARDAQLYEVEEFSECLALVLSGGRTIAMEGSEDIGVVGQAVQATSQLSATQWTAMQKQAMQKAVNESGNASPLSPASSSARSLEDDPQVRWLGRYTDCVLPSANGHVFILLPLDRVYRDAGFDPAIDLTIKKRDLFEGATTKQLLVAVLCDDQHRPIGAFEALVATKNPVHMDFLDAFASLLAAALEARRSICRPAIGAGPRVQIVFEDEVTKESVPLDAPATSGMLELVIAPGTKMVVTGGTNSQRAENDLPLLEAVREPMAQLFSQVQLWQRRGEQQEKTMAAEQDFWTAILALVVTSGSSDSGAATFRSDVRSAIQALAALPNVRFTALFEGETLDKFTRSDIVTTETSTLSREGQFAALERAIRTGETFASTPFLTAVPVVAGELHAAVLMLVESVDGEDDKTRVLSLVMKAVELALWAECYQTERGAARVEGDVLREAVEHQEACLRERDVVLQLGDHLAECRSLEAIAALVNQFSTADESEVQLPRMTLFLAEYLEVEGQFSDTEATVVRSIWTTKNAGERVAVFEREAVTSPRRKPDQQRGGGMAATVLASGKSMTYTPQHIAYDPDLRRKLQLFELAEEDIYYFAVPLCPTPSARVLGVLEFALTSEDEQKQFASSTVATLISSIVEKFVGLHHWISSTRQRQARNAADTRNEHVKAWEMWGTLMNATNEAATLDITSWKTVAEARLKDLMPHATHVNVFVRARLTSMTNGDDQIIEVVTHELVNSKTSASLNVYNNAVLRGVLTYPLGDLGLLVIASSACEPTILDAGVAPVGPLTSELLGFQLNHIYVQQRSIADVEALHRSLAHVERSLSSEQELRRRVEQHSAMQSVLVQVGQLMDDASDADSVDEHVSKILRAITRQPTGAESSHHARVFRAGLLCVDGEKDGVWWSEDTSGFRLASIDIRCIPSSSSIIAYDAPLQGLQAEFAQRFWPMQDFANGRRLVIAPVGEAPYGHEQSSRSGYLVLLLSNGMKDDDSFASDLARAVERVVKSRNQKCRYRDVQVQVDATTRALEFAKTELTAVTNDHSRSTEMWPSVLQQLWTLRASDVVQEVVAMRDQLFKSISDHVQAQLNGVCESSEVRLVSQDQLEENLLKDVMSEWLRPAELLDILAQPRRPRISTGGQTAGEFCGSLGNQVLALYWKLTDDPTRTSVLAARVCGKDSGRLQETVDTMLIQARELAVVVENVLALDRRVEDAASMETRLVAQLDEETTQLAAARDNVSRRATLDHLLAKLQDRAVLEEVINETSDYCLWLRDTEDLSRMHSTLRDGTKLTRLFDPPAVGSSHCAAAIHVNGDCVGVLEVVQDRNISAEELNLVAAVVQSAFTRRDRERKLLDAHAEAESHAREVTRVREDDEGRRRALVGHWHAINALLCGVSESTEWTETLAQVERTIEETIAEIEAVRVVLMGVDAKTHAMESAFPSPAHHSLCTLLDLWDAHDEVNYRRSKVLTAREETAQHLRRYLFRSSMNSCDSEMILLSATGSPVDSTTTRRTFFVLVGLTPLGNAPLSAEVHDALEMDLQLVVTVHELSQVHEMTRRRAVEAEMARVATEEQRAETQQWVAFMEHTQHEALRLIETTRGLSGERTWASVATQAEAFVQVACACDAVELYSVATGSDGHTRQRVLLSTGSISASLSPSAPSRAFAESLDAVVNVDQWTLPAVETTPSGSRIVSAIHDLQSQVVTGVLVIYWNQDTAPSKTTLEVVDTIVRPWLGTVFAIVHESEKSRTRQESNTQQISSLSDEKSELEVQGLELKSHLMQAEQRNVALQGSLQLAAELLEQLEGQIASVARLSEASTLWSMVANQVGAVRSIQGVQVYEMGEEVEPTMVLSTLSNAEDASIHKNISSRERDNLVRRCFASTEPQESRIPFASEYKRARVVSLGASRCLLLVFARDEQTSHQQRELVDRFVTLCVTIAANRVTEIERMELQAAAASALETATQDLTRQLHDEHEELANTQSRLRWSEELTIRLTRDLISHEIWKGLDKPTQVPTAKLTVMWTFLQDTARRRLERALPEAAGMTVQLYGVVNGANSRGAFVFSLPTASVDTKASKGFFCVPLSDFEQRREWRKMAQCIKSGRTRGALGDGGMVLFPVREYGTPSTMRSKICELDHDESDETEPTVADEATIVVGVFLVKMRVPVPHLQADVNVLVQEFADALAPRVNGIGHIVYTKQCAMNQSKATTTARRVQPGTEVVDTTHRLEVHTLTQALDAAPRNQSVSAPSTSNQDDSQETYDNVDGLDSEDERQAERARDQRRAEVTGGVLDFVLKVQALGAKDRDAALRFLVARELKNVWCGHGDERKNRLGTCELFYVVDGVVCDQLDRPMETTTVLPWVATFIENQTLQKVFQLWKIDSRRWIASMSVESDHSLAAVLVSLCGAPALGDVFDADDERNHLPRLVRAVGLEASRIVEAISQREVARQLKDIDEKQASQRNAIRQQEYDALERRLRLNDDLRDVTARLPQAADERVVVQTALDAMQRFLDCPHVAYHPTLRSGERVPPVEMAQEEYHDPSSCMATMETLLRVRVVASDELLGTLVARLNEHERVGTETLAAGDRAKWTMRLVQCLADATATALVRLRERRLLHQAETSLLAASEAMETQQHELMQLQDKHESLQHQLSKVSSENQRLRQVDEENDVLSSQLEELRDEQQTREETKETMTKQLKQYETQLVQVNHQLERSIEAETQLLRMEEAFAATQVREARLEKKLLKQKLQLKHLVAERTARREQDERDQAELAYLRRQVAVLTEKQQHHHGGMDASSVAAAVLQAQAQAMAQTQAFQQSQTESKQLQQQQQQRLHTAVQRRMVRHLQLQQQQQKRKQLDLAHELRQLAALEVQEMTRRPPEDRSSSPRKMEKPLQSSHTDVAAVHEIRAPTATRESDPIAARAATSKLRPPRIAVTDRRPS